MRVQGAGRRGTAAEAALQAAPFRRWLIDPFDSTVVMLPDAEEASPQPKAPRLALQCLGACETAAGGSAGSRATQLVLQDVQRMAADARIIELALDVHSSWADGVVRRSEEVFPALTQGSKPGVARTGGSAGGSRNTQYERINLTIDVSKECADSNGTTLCGTEVVVSASVLADIAGVAEADMAAATLQLQLRLNAQPIAASPVQHAAFHQHGKQMHLVRWAYPAAVLPPDGAAASSVAQLSGDFSSAMVVYDPAASAVDLLVVQECSDSSVEATVQLQAGGTVGAGGVAARTPPPVTLPCAPRGLQAGSAARAIMYVGASIASLVLIAALAALAVLLAAALARRGGGASQRSRTHSAAAVLACTLVALLLTAQRIALVSLPSLCHANGCVAPGFVLLHWTLLGSPVPVQAPRGLPAPSVLFRSDSASEVAFMRAAPRTALLDASGGEEAPPHRLMAIAPQQLQLEGSDVPAPRALALSELLQSGFAAQSLAQRMRATTWQLALGWLLAVGALAAIGAATLRPSRGWAIAAAQIAAVMLPPALAIGIGAASADDRGDVAAGALLAVLALLTLLLAAIAALRLARAARNASNSNKSPALDRELKPSSLSHQVPDTDKQHSSELGASDSTARSQANPSYGQVLERSGRRASPVDTAAKMPADDRKATAGASGRLRAFAASAAAQLRAGASARLGSGSAPSGSESACVPVPLVEADDALDARFFAGGGGRLITVVTCDGAGGGIVRNPDALAKPAKALRVRTELGPAAQAQEMLQEANQSFVRLLRDKQLLPQPQALALRAANTLALCDERFLRTGSSHWEMAQVDSFLNMWPAVHVLSLSALDIRTCNTQCLDLTFTLLPAVSVQHVLQCDQTSDLFLV